jgi:molybdopterin/thiamine biosynthesis adenylyltransferase/rhodanese-related sulfurtransferase
MTESTGPASITDFTQPELLHYSRQMIMPELGLDGQRTLKNSRVLMVGAGGLGSPAGLYLAAAGVGTLGIVEFDHVEASNLHRQVLYGTDQLGQPKLDMAIKRLRSINPHINIVPHAFRLSAENALSVIAEYDVVVDGTDNFATRYLINDACVLLKKHNVHASIFRFDGLLSIFGDAKGPCYRCLYPEPPPPELVPSCAEAGVLGVLPGIMGALQANETIKLLLAIGEPLVGRLLKFNALEMRFYEFEVNSDPHCPICSVNPSIHALIDYEQFCGVEPLDNAPDGEACPNITARVLKSRLGASENLLLLDNRGPIEFATGQIPGAILRPVDAIDEWIDTLDKQAVIVCYCQSGVRSRKAAMRLRQAGFSDVVSLEGGIVSWMRDDDSHAP